MPRQRAGIRHRRRGTLPLASTLYITEVAVDADGETRFPDFDRSRFVEVGREHHEADEQNPLAHDFVVYQLAAHR